MKILIVCSGNAGDIAPFVREQCDSVSALSGYFFDFFFIKGKGILGYLRNYPGYRNKIKQFKPDIIHAHYGLSALLANLQRKVPVISTFHGSDVWVFRKNRFFSKIAHYLSSGSIVVEPKMKEKLGIPGKTEIIPCAVDLENFYPLPKPAAMSELHGILKENKINILFSSYYGYYEKNFPLAQKTLRILGDRFNLIELKGFSRSEVNLLLNGCNLALMTSLSEGSPQFIKEAMACNCPVVSTDVGDVKWVVGNIEGCYITSFDPQDIAEKIILVADFSITKGKTNGRQRILDLGLDSKTIARKIVRVYEEVLKR